MNTSPLLARIHGLCWGDRCIKRTIDLVGASLGLLATGWLILLAAAVARWDTGQPGIFRQIRVGRHGRRFSILKIRTMRSSNGHTTTVTTSGDPRVTRLGRLFRRLKIDELPQLWNVLRGDMSLVGPRPDVPSLVDQLCGADLLVITVRPGITGPASLKYRDEEQLLADQPDPEYYNQHVIYPDKVRLNRLYIQRYRIRDDFRYLWMTLSGARLLEEGDCQPVDTAARTIRIDQVGVSTDDQVQHPGRRAA